MLISQTIEICNSQQIKNLNYIYIHNITFNHNENSNIQASKYPVNQKYINNLYCVIKSHISIHGVHKVWTYRRVSVKFGHTGGCL